MDISWNEVAGVESIRYWGTPMVQITLNTGRKIRTGSQANGSYTQTGRIVEHLLSIRRHALGTVDPPELAEALAAAERGDPRSIDELLAENKIDGVVYSERLHGLAEEGRVDLEALRETRKEL
jgi:hypothetical protein